MQEEMAWERRDPLDLDRGVVHGKAEASSEGISGRQDGRSGGLEMQMCREGMEQADLLEQRAYLRVLNGVVYLRHIRKRG